MLEQPFQETNQGRNENEVIEETIRNAADIKTSSDFQICRTCPAGKIGSKLIWPALAIPLKTKDTFECPSVHLNYLQEFLPQTKKIITIGWRGMETHFLKLLEKALGGRQVGILVIDKDTEQAQAVIQNLAAEGIAIGAAIPYETGFTGAIRRQQIEKY
jgi:hypothetical protein